MHAVCERAARDGLSVGLYGATPDVNLEVRRRLVERFPSLDIRYSWSPPFRDLTPEEDDGVVQAVVASEAEVLFVSLGCPRQERWMYAHRDRVPCVMLGVGAAFDMIAGRLAVAPRWMQRAGLEWAFRLVSEPTRLWRRYAQHNIRFVALVLLQRARGGRYAQRGEA